MAQSLTWSNEALDDIDDIAEYIARDSVYYAQRVVQQIFELGDTLLDQPELGRIVPELNDPKVRERFIFSYRLIYEIDLPDIYILAVIHGNRLLDGIRERFGDDN